MKYRIKVNVEPINIEGILSGANAAEVVKNLKSEAAKRAGLKGMAIRMMPDESFMAAIVDAHNKRFSASEPKPKSANDLINFGVKVGYLTPLEG